MTDSEAEELSKPQVTHKTDAQRERIRDVCNHHLNIFNNI